MEESFETILVTQEKDMLAAYKESIYIYYSSGSYIEHQYNSPSSLMMYQMKKVSFWNDILINEASYINRDNIDVDFPGNPLVTNKLLDYSDTQTEYYTIKILEWDTDNIAIGGRTYPSGSSISYGYVELFHLDGYYQNSNLQSIPNKRWVGMDAGCRILIIREIQTGVIIFGGDDDCTNICTWEYVTTKYKEPICLPIGGRAIWDIVSLS